MVILLLVDMFLMKLQQALKMAPFGHVIADQQ